MATLGDFPSMYTVSGYRMTGAYEEDGLVVLTVTDEHCPEELDPVLARYPRRGGVPAFTGDRVAFANALLAAQWSRRRPRRPAWLHRLVVGKAPRV